MKWTVEVETDYIRIVCVGDFNLADAKAAGSAVYEEAAKHQTNRVLLDWTQLTGVPTDTDRYEMGRHVAEAYARQNPVRYVKVAVLGRSPLLSESRIGETVARNRGAHGIVTDRLEEALEYLGLTASDPGSNAPSLDA